MECVIYTHTHTHTHTYIITHTHVHICVCTCVCIPVKEINCQTPPAVPTLRDLNFSNAPAMWTFFYSPPAEDLSFL